MMMHENVFLPREKNDRVEVEELSNKPKKNRRGNYLEKLTISGLDSKMVEIKLDQEPPNWTECTKLSCFISDDNKKADSRCDVITFEPLDNDKCRIMIGELKTTIKPDSNYQTKLINSRIYIEYVLALISTHYKDYTIPQFEYVVFYNKKKATLDKTGLNQANGSSTIEVRFVKVDGNTPIIEYGRIWDVTPELVCDVP